ncbi:MAG: KUP/HAK/KT family potassium transporter [Acetobacteraceae bacterium]|nr:KUP/HAK/KT family potassium transporter [Acetobacteraceae bacterium]
MADTTTATRSAALATELPITASAATAALGIVYGDLGTSPLYTLQTVVGATGGTLNADTALGMLSLIFWALIITISTKYCLFVMRADNHGEGGILALMSLLGGATGRWAGTLVAMGLFGAALIYGDGIITPAISVLSALEGVNVATDALKPYVMPCAVLILLLLFAAQTFGTARIARVFGPVMMLWFAVIGLIGLVRVVHHPAVLAAFDPAYAIGFLIGRGWGSFMVLGGVFLALTGGEAMYADMGHIGRNPIRAAWYCVVLPALLLSYAGQVAGLLNPSSPKGNPFFLIVPSWALYPMVVLATLATIIASQAIITGVFSLTRQAMQLGWFPGLNIRQTSDREYGQIYVPFANWTMMLLTLALTIGFGSSDRLAGAYGTAVSTTMLLTTALLFEAMRQVWGWPTAVAAPVAGIFLVIDLAFFGANLLKIADGGWIPLLLGLVLFMVMTTWHRGIRAVRARLAALTEPQANFLARFQEGHIPRVPGTAVFLSRGSSPVPPLLVRHVNDIGAVQESIVSLTVRFEEVPRVIMAERVRVEEVAEGFWHVTVRFGFVEVPNLTLALIAARDLGCTIDLEHAIYFASRDEVVPGGRDRLLPNWRRMLFSFMFRNAVRPVDHFALPRERFVEIGRQLEL